MLCPAQVDGRAEPVLLQPLEAAHDHLETITAIGAFTEAFNEVLSLAGLTIPVLFSMNIYKCLQYNTFEYLIV